MLVLIVRTIPAWPDVVVPLQVSPCVHTGVQDAGDVDCVRLDPVEDTMPFNRIDKQVGQQFRPGSADMGMVAQKRERLVQPAPVDRPLRFAPGQFGVDLYIDEVVLGFWCEDEGQWFRGRHQL